MSDGEDAVEVDLALSLIMTAMLISDLWPSQVMASKFPNPAHEAIVGAEAAAKAGGKSFAVVTQNIDGLHARAGSQHVVELHGNLFKTRCTRCGDVRVNTGDTT